jgi:hypothetical protein
MTNATTQISARAVMTSSQLTGACMKSLKVHCSYALPHLRNVVPVPRVTASDAFVPREHRDALVVCAQALEDGNACIDGQRKPVCKSIL